MKVDSACATKNYSIEDVIKAIKGSRGIVSNVARKLNCSWFTAKKYIDKWQYTQKALLCEIEEELDVTESALMAKVVEGDVTAIKYKLNCHGKQRGYGERIGIDHLGEIIIKPPTKTNE